MRYFRAVAEELHFGRAAEQLAIAQSAVSQQVRRLERELGVDLFDRTTRTVTLTTAGFRFLPHAHRILDAAEQARVDLDDLRHERNRTVRLGTSTGLGGRLEVILRSFAQQAPAASLELVSLTLATRLRHVASGDLDAALFHGELPEGSSLNAIPVWDDRLVVALPDAHPVGGGTGAVALADLADFPLRIASRRRNPVLHDLIVDSCAATGFVPIMGPNFSTDQDTLAAIASGPPSWTVYFAAQAGQLRNPGIVFRPIRAPAPYLTARLALRRSKPTGELRALVAACLNSPTI
ncbi:MAG: LysR family transcriptional regulator [Propionibacteriales bacterium]|nr:LysR family transcriptional regulator [Propionibacteriales bacterium]